MFKRLLVALDLSKSNELIFQAALDIAKSTAASMLLVHITSVDAPESPSMPTLIGSEYASSSSATSAIAIYEELWQAYEEKGHKMLQAFEAQAIQAGVSIEYTQNSGAPAKMICILADSEKADLIIIGRRGHSGWSELVAGSVSNYVMHHAPCSVLIIQNIGT